MARFEPLRLSQLPPEIWRSSLRVRFGSCDPAGIVYTPEYLNLFNGVIEDWYTEALGLSDFARPSAMGDILEVAVLLHRIGRRSFTFSTHAFNGDLECVRTTFVTVTTSLVDHKAIDLPADLRRGLDEYYSSCGQSLEIGALRAYAARPVAADRVNPS